MQIIEYRPEHLIALTRIYNDLTRCVPHCYAIEPSEMAAAIDGQCGIENNGERLTAEALFVAQEVRADDAGNDDDLLGFVHVGEGPSKVGEDPVGVIRFLAYPRRRDVGQALLTEAEAWLRQRGQQTVIAFPQAYRYPFYAFPHAFISNNLEHVQALLLFNGYEASNGEVFLDWPDFKPAPPAEDLEIDCELVVEYGKSAGRLPNITVRAFQASEKIGICKMLCAREFSQMPDMEEWTFCMWLWVDDPHQGKRLGRALLARGLVESKQAGYRHAAISTAWDNHRALLFYANHGFHAVDRTRQFRRDLTQSN